MLVDFCTLGAVPIERLRQAEPASICLKTAPTKADTLLPEDHHYQVRPHQFAPVTSAGSLPSGSHTGAKACKHAVNHKAFAVRKVGIVRAT